MQTDIKATLRTNLKIKLSYLSSARGNRPSYPRPRCSVLPVHQINYPEGNRRHLHFFLLHLNNSRERGRVYTRRQDQQFSPSSCFLFKHLNTRESLRNTQSSVLESCLRYVNNHGNTGEGRNDGSGRDDEAAGASCFSSSETNYIY